MPRPKKNKNQNDSEVSRNEEVESSKEKQFEIECSLIPILKSKYSSDTPESEKRLGIYSGSVHRVKDFGTKKWVVHFYLKVDHEHYINNIGVKYKELIDGCLNYLNNNNKKKVKKEYKPKFGYLQPLVDPVTGDYSVVYKPDRIVVSAITDERDNPNFWYEGQRL